LKLYETVQNDGKVSQNQLLIISANIKPGKEESFEEHEELLENFILPLELPSNHLVSFPSTYRIKLSQ
jgi:hypothetical protein